MPKMNGSMTRLAVAFAGVFQEHVDIVADMERRIINKLENVETKVEGIDTKVTSLETAVTTTNQNMAAQFATLDAPVVPRKKSGRRARAAQRK